MLISEDRSRLDVDLVHRELAASYWSPGVAREVVEAAIACSECFGAYTGPQPGGAQIGFARLVTDRATFGWLADVFVCAPHRGAGVGTALVTAVVERARSYRLRRLLLATRDAHGLYARFGFAQTPPGLMMALAVTASGPAAG